jgi:hypothetical protein
MACVLDGTHGGGVVKSGSPMVDVSLRSTKVKKEKESVDRLVSPSIMYAFSMAEGDRGELYSFDKST